MFSFEKALIYVANTCLPSSVMQFPYLLTVRSMQCAKVSFDVQQFAVIYELYKLCRPSFCSVIYLCVFKHMTLFGFIGYCQEGKRSATQVQAVLTQGRDSFNCGVMSI